MHHAQPKAGAPPGRFSSVERLDDPAERLVRYAAAGIGDLQDHVLSRRDAIEGARDVRIVGLEGNRSSLQHRVAGIECQV